MYLIVGTSVRSIVGDRKLGRTGEVYLSPICQEQKEEEQQGGAETIRLRQSPTKQRRRAQWSKGDAPGEYGGPPVDLRIRKTWGGEPLVDPLTATDDYIWKKDWQAHVEAPPSSVQAAPPPPKEKDFGFLSLNRAIALDSMDLDLSRELSKPAKATLDRQVAVARQMAADENKPKWRFAPTKREEEQWARAKKAVSGGTEHLLQEVNRERKDPVTEAAAARERYLKLKNNLQIVTLAVGGAGLAGAYFSYSPEIAASYGVGLLGALVYIRMLGNSVDSVGARDAGGAVRGALGQPRLLVPVVLVMAFNRWNGLVVPEYGVMPLQLIPMLVGFFTYKAATFVETFKELLPDSAKQEKEN
ncbi:unnamed protein product [Sphagnum compactum]